MTVSQIPLPAHVSYARVVTPSTTYHAFTVQYIDSKIMLHAYADIVTLDDSVVSETVEGWRAAGTNAAGQPEIWTIRKLSCGCNRAMSSTRTGDIPA